MALWRYGAHSVRLRSTLSAAVVLGAAAVDGSTAKEACQPFDAAEVRKVLRFPVGAPKGTAGAEMLSCTAQAGNAQVTLSYSLLPNWALGSEGEFEHSVEQARAAGHVEERKFKETRCASILPSGGSKFGAFKAWCVLHSKTGRAVTLEVIAPNAKQLPALEKVCAVAEAAGARIR